MREAFFFFVSCHLPDLSQRHSKPLKNTGAPLKVRVKGTSKLQGQQPNCVFLQKKKKIKVTGMQPQFGRFLVLEGIDGAGTTTQLKRIERNLLGLGKNVYTTREPSDGPIGAMARQIMAKSEVSQEELKQAKGSGHPSNTKAYLNPPPDWATMALLFAADRLAHLHVEIEPQLRAGSWVISDRYDASSLGYQSLARASSQAETLAWIRSLNGYARRPDLTLVLLVDTEVAHQRRQARGEPEQLYEKQDMQKKLSFFYQELSSHLPGDRIVYVDGNQSEDEVEQDLMKYIMSEFSELGSFKKNLL